MLPVRDHLPTRSVPVVNYLLIALNVGVFGWEVSTMTGGTDTTALGPWTLRPADLVAHPLANAPSLFTHMFLHASLAHVAGNMLFLWIFGDNVEDALGHARYLVFYLACGLAAAFAQIAVSPHSTVPMLGASGAISGVLAAYGVLYPRSPITVVNPIPFMWLFWGLFVSFPAWLVILEFFAANLWNAFQSSSGAPGGVAFMAHVGGFVAGLLLLPLLRTQEPVEYDPWEQWLTGFSRARRPSAR
jgi:membrane associated rhomboid family serine protease